MSKNLDLLLVNSGGSKKRVYQELSEDYSAIEPPFWSALTAGFIQNRGYDVNILDANAKNLSFNETAKEIENINPKLVNIVVYGQHPSASTQLMSSVGDLCKTIKEINSERKIILTGLHPSALPKRTITEESCDYVAEGEGFHTLIGLLENNRLNKIPGLWYKESGEIKSNSRAQNIKNLTEELGNVAWDLLDLDKGIYKAHNWQCLDNFNERKNYASLSTSLGCPFQCDFCSIWKTYGERGVRYWNPKWVVDQIEYLFEEKNVKTFKIIDEMFLLKPSHYKEISNKLIERGLGDKINIWAYARVDTTKENDLELIRKAGFKWLCFGFESGNNEIIKEVNKGQFTKEDMKRLSDKVKSFDINILGNYMFGFPNDNLETMQETLDLAIDQNCEFVNLYCAIAWPGSKLYEETLNKGIRTPKSWSDFAQHSYGFIPLPTKNISSEKVLKFRDDAFQKYFTNNNYLNMIEKKFGIEAKRHIEKMSQFKLKREIFRD
ncbi:MAG TPA: radical SAM protein [Candidatus Paceibacterota bacterium]|nr:radical SAM protein [Candidatus Paceibacterota bacterium]